MNSKYVSAVEIKPVEEVVIIESEYEKMRVNPEKLLEDFMGIIAKSIPDMGRVVGVKHRTVTHGDPVYSPLRRKAHTLKPIVAKKIEEMLENDIIRPSSSPYSSAVAIVNKKSGEKRFCIDYRKLNSITVKNKHPLLRIDKTIDYHHGATIFRRSTCSVDTVRSSSKKRTSTKPLLSLSRGFSNSFECLWE